MVAKKEEISTARLIFSLLLMLVVPQMFCEVIMYGAFVGNTAVIEIGLVGCIISVFLCLITLPSNDWFEEQRRKQFESGVR